MMKLLIRVILSATAALIAATAVANADPGNSCAGITDQRLCSPSSVFYCPSTGGMVTWMQPCPEYVVGPHQAGMPPDND